MRENIVILKSEAANVGCVCPSGLGPVTGLDAGNFRFLPQQFLLYMLYVYTHLQTCLRAYIEKERERERERERESYFTNKTPKRCAHKFMFGGSFNWSHGTSYDTLVHQRDHHNVSTTDTTEK